MLDLSPRKEDLDPIEMASRDEIAALQLKRLKWTLRHVYDNVPHYWKKFDQAGVHPDDLNSLDDLAKFPFTDQGGPARQLSVRHVRGADPSRSCAPTPPPAPPASRPWWATPRAISTRWADVVARSIRASGGRPGMRVHVSYGYGLFTGGLGAHYGAERLGCMTIPVSGGMTERQVQLICDFEPDIIMVTPSYMLAILDEFRKQGLDPRKTSLKVGIFGAEPWTQRHAQGDRAGVRHARRRHLRSVRGDGPGRRQRVRGDQGRTAHLGGPFLSGDHRSGQRQGAARRREGRAGVHHTDQGGHAGDPLSHARPDAPAARNGAQHAAHGEDHGPLRRHDDRARRQRVPDADRGDAAEDRAAVCPLPGCPDARGAHGRDGGGGGNSPGGRYRGEPVAVDRAAWQDASRMP